MTHIGPHVSLRTSKLKTHGRRWRQGTSQASNAVPHAAPNGCPAAAIAEEIAAVLRLVHTFNQDRPEHDPELVAVLDGPIDYLSAEDLKHAAWDRLRALEKMVAHRRATSPKGALLQLYLAASKAQYPAGRMLDGPSARDKISLDQNDRLVTRLNYSVAAWLEAQALDEDMIALRAWYFTPNHDTHRACDVAMTDREKLVAEVKANAIFEAPDEPSA